VTRKDQSGGGMTGATGDLTPDDIQRDFEPGEWREASDAAHHADVTRAQASHAPAQRGDIGEPGEPREAGGPTELAGRESGYGSDHGLSPDDPAYRMEIRPRTRPPDESEAREPREPRIGGDEQADHEEHF
jgi:hypothetical protein